MGSLYLPESFFHNFIFQNIDNLKPQIYYTKLACSVKSSTVVMTPVMQILFNEILNIFSKYQFLALSNLVFL